MGLLVRQNVTDAQWQATISIIRDLHKIKKCDFRMFEHRHGWRIVKDWTQAQMAIIETRMVRMEQVFLPYIVAPTGDTLYEFLVQRRFLLAAPDDSSGETVDGEVAE